MTPLASRVDVGGTTFADNSRFMGDYVERVRQVEARMRATEEKFLPTARKRGKLLPRERLALLLDRGAPFVELNTLAGYQMYSDSDGSLAGGNLIAGIGFVSGRRCLVIVWNYAVKGGTVSRVTVEKMLRLQQIARQNRLPIVSLSESGGGDLAGGGGFDAWEATTFLQGGLCYCHQAEFLDRGPVQVVVAHGNATAGGAYHVALSDYIVLVKGQTQLFLAGPPLLKAATGADASAEELGGADMHARVSGTGEHLAENDADGIRIARSIVAQLPAPHASESRAEVEPPRYDPSELIGIVPEDRRAFYDAREIIARLVDGSQFLEFAAEIDQGTLAGHARIGGYKVGLLANNAPITPLGADKATRFLEACDKAELPVIFLQNTTGFLVGIDAERGGQVKHGARMIRAVANLRTPKIALVVGNSYGAGNYAMASRALKPHFVFSWPTARTAVMGGAQAGKVLQIVTEAKLQRSGTPVDDATRARLAAQGTAIEAGIDAISESMYCSARLFDDGIIDPRDSRNLLCFLLETCAEAAR